MISRVWFVPALVDWVRSRRLIWAPSISPTYNVGSAGSLLYSHQGRRRSKIEFCRHCLHIADQVSLPLRRPADVQFHTRDGQGLLYQAFHSCNACPRDFRIGLGPDGNVGDDPSNIDSLVETRNLGAVLVDDIKGGKLFSSPVR